MIIRIPRMTRENSGHVAKSSVPKPVVVMTELTEKATWCTASRTVLK